MVWQNVQGIYEMIEMDAIKNLKTKTKGAIFFLVVVLTLHVRFYDVFHLLTPNDENSKSERERFSESVCGVGVVSCCFLVVMFWLLFFLGPIAVSRRFLCTSRLHSTRVVVSVAG